MSGPVRATLVLLDGCVWQGHALPGRRTHALLAALALRGGRPVPDARLIEEVWGPDDQPANPTKALQVLVSRVRAQPGPELVIRAGPGYRLADVAVDAVELRQQADQATAALAAGDPATARALAEATAAVTIGSDRSSGAVDGSPGAGDSRGDDGPVAALRQRAIADRDRARSVLGRALSRLGRHTDAVGLLTAAAADRPDDEAVLVDLLHSEAAVRGAPAALRRYERYRQRVRDELGTDPGPELQRLHAELLVRDQPVRTNLRWDASRLIGREEDLVMLGQLTRTARVTSIVGAGGLGKTRLAHAVGRSAEQPAVHFVELAGVSTPDGVAIEVGTVLGVREAVSSRRAAEAVSRVDLHTRILERIVDVPTLLILDNCEHVVQAAADLVAVLIARAPHLHVLTTTRTPLGLAAEQVYPLGQLDLVDGVDLFRERAVAARPGMRWDAERAEELVRRLDGLPLAIELAAARVRVMSIEEIARRLEDRFALLRGGIRDAPERHQTLLAVIDWSWNLLGERERAALRRLSVFRDGFGLEAAAVVIGVADAVDVVTALVDQSLIGVVEGDQVRFRMLETVREFGRAALTEADEVAATDRRLRGWATELAVAQLSRLYGTEQVAAVHELQREEGNLTDVLLRAVDDRDRPTAVLLANALFQLWSIQGSHLKVVNLATRIEDVLVPADPNADGNAAGKAEGAAADPDPRAADDDVLVEAERGALTAVVTNTMIFTGAPSPRSLARLRQLGPDSRSDHVRASVIVLLTLLDHPDDEVAALEALTTGPDDAVARFAGGWSSQAFENAGDAHRALRTAQYALGRVLADEGPWAAAMLRAQLAGLAAQVGDGHTARSYAEASLPVMDTLGAVEDAIQLRGTLAMVALAEGQHDLARERLDEIAGTEHLDLLLGAGVVVVSGRAELALALGRVDEGLLLYREAISRLRARTAWWVSVPEFAPWVIYPESAALVAHVRAGRADQVTDLRQALRTKARGLLDPAATEDGTPDLSAFLDVPVLGCALFALGYAALSESSTGPAETPADRDARWETACRLLVLADRFSYNRLLPSMRFEPAAELAEARCPGRLAAIRAEWTDRSATDLRPVAADHILRV